MRIRTVLAPLAVAIAVVAVASVAVVLVAGNRPAVAARQVMSLEGFPLDRTLAGLTTFPDVDAVVLVNDVRLGAARWTTPTGAEPAYITERRAPTMGEGGHGYIVVTGFTARVERTLLGQAAPTVTGRIAGGSVGNVDFVAGDEMAPEHSAMTGRLLLAGEVVDGELRPAFVYRVTPDGNAVSLLASASTAQATFSIAALETALAAR